MENEIQENNAVKCLYSMGDQRFFFNKMIFLYKNYLTLNILFYFLYNYLLK